MKTTFGRTICTTVIILLAALLLLGTSFQASVKEYLTDTVVSNLQENATRQRNSRPFSCGKPFIW